MSCPGFLRCSPHLLLWFICVVTVSSAPTAKSYAIDTNAFSDILGRQNLQPELHSPSALASKVIYQSPPMPANVYKELIVSSKPLSLRKYNNGLKTKKTKKDSRIYYIPIPAMPYRYIPGVGYDYQPMKIKPVLKEKPTVNKMHGSISQQGHRQQQEQSPYSQQPHFTNIIPSTSAPEVSNSISKVDKESKADVANDSKVYRMQRGNYYFNGRPFRLQVAKAHPKNKLTSKNLKSKLYFNKAFIY